jgi:hypothetical protein
MRVALAESTPRAGTAEGYPAGSIVICQGCLKPLYVLLRGIGPGERAGRSASAFRPFQMKDFARLNDSQDAGVAGAMAAWSDEDRKTHVDSIPEVKSGSPMLCPCCGASYVRVRAAEAGEVIDRAYVVELVTIPPGRTLSGKEARAWTR